MLQFASRCDSALFADKVQVSSLQKLIWIFRHSSLLLTVPMAQKPKSSAKSKKAIKPAPAKAKAAAKPKPKLKPRLIKAKAAPANHKPSPKIFAKPAKSKAKSIANGGDEDHEPQRPQVRLPRDAKTLAFFERQNRRLLDLREHLLDHMHSVAMDKLLSRAAHN